MKLILSTIALVILAGCASPTPDAAKVVEINTPTRPNFSTPVQPPAPQQVIDNRCAALAKNTRAIALIRDSGIPQDDALLLTEAAADYPIVPMIREVYSRTDITPSGGAKNSYSVCVKVGYDTMVAALIKSDQDYEANEHLKLQDAVAARKKAAELRTKKGVKLKLDDRFKK